MIFIENQYVELEKEINTYLLKSMEGGYDAFSEADWIFVHEIAARCPQEYGEGVLKARALWLGYGGGFERAWQDCFPIDETSQSEGRDESIKNEEQKSNSTLEQLLVYPVPVSDVLSLSVPIDYLMGTYQICNVAGMQVDRGIINSENEQIAVQQLSNGLHFLQVSAPNKRPITLKFVVQKL
jgi:hypothetical protein